MAGIATEPLRVRWDDYADDPYPVYRVLRDEAPVYFDEANHSYVVTRYDDVAVVLRDSKRFSSRPLDEVTGKRPQMSPIKDEDAPTHTFRRRTVTPLFGPREMRQREQYFKDVARDLVAGLAADSEVDGSTEVAIPLVGRVTCDLIGIPYDLHDDFRRLTEERLDIMRVRYQNLDPSTVRSMDEVRADLGEIVNPVAAQRRAQPQNDAISMLVNAKPDKYGNEMTETLFPDMLMHLLAGGFETTQHLIEMLLHMLADRPDLWQRLQADRSLIDAAIEEMLRWDVPVQALRRRATEDVVIAGVDIPADSNIVPVLGSANRDERIFADPDLYDIDRDMSRHMAFGVGVHYCPGAPVSRDEVSALLNALFDRFARVERSGDSLAWPQTRPVMMVGGMHGFAKVPIRFIRS